jgi:hypothetical protein
MRVPDSVKWVSAEESHPCGEIIVEEINAVCMQSVKSVHFDVEVNPALNYGHSRVWRGRCIRVGDRGVDSYGVK